jgi:hypothetical protein
MVTVRPHALTHPARPEHMAGHRTQMVPGGVKFPLLAPGLLDRAAGPGAPPSPGCPQRPCAQQPQAPAGGSVAMRPGLSASPRSTGGGGGAARAFYREQNHANDVVSAHFAGATSLLVV